MDSAPPIVRIAVLQPLEGLAASGAADTLAALGRIGAEVEFDVADTADACLRSGSREGVDLVVLDRCASHVSESVLQGLGDEGPPVVVVIDSDQAEAVALDAFRAGAADCVRIGRDYAEVMPVVALEQIRRWRQLRERTTARRRIAWLERLHDAMISEIPVSLMVLDGAGRVALVNPEFTRAFGASVEQVTGARFEQVFPTDFIESGGLRDLISRGQSSVQGAARLARHRAASGEPRIFDVRCRRLDEQGHVLLVLSDVSESEILAKRLLDLERYNENIIQSINSALLVVDTEGCITFVNPTAGEILAAEGGKLIGRQVGDWFDGHAEEGSLIARTLKEGVRFKGAETMITLDDGSVLPIGISCTPLLDDERQLRGAVAIFQDLSEIKQLQRQVLQTEKLASIGQLAAGVAHEINNPMGFIHANLYQMSEYLQDLQGYWEGAERLQTTVAAADWAAAQRACESLSRLAEEIDIDFVRGDFGKAVRESQEGSERIRHIVQDLKDFSHQDTAERMLADINQCVDSTASIVWTMMKHSVVLEKEYQDLPQIRCYPMQLKQVFMNLLVNAYQAVEERLGESCETGETGTIRIVTARVDGGVAISISDSGVGIAQDSLARIFDPFFTTKDVGVGTGLGLSTSYGIVQRHGGTMRVESEVGKGSTFEVWLPEGTQPAEVMRS